MYKYGQKLFLAIRDKTQHLLRLAGAAGGQERVAEMDALKADNAKALAALVGRIDERDDREPPG